MTAPTTSQNAAQVDVSFSGNLTTSQIPSFIVQLAAFLDVPRTSVQSKQTSATMRLRRFLLQYQYSFIVKFNSFQDAAMGSLRIINNISALNDKLSQVAINPVVLVATPIVTTLTPVSQLSEAAHDASLPSYPTTSSPVTSPATSSSIVFNVWSVAGVLILVGAGVGVALCLRNHNNPLYKAEDSLFAKNNVIIKQDKMP